MVDGHTSGRSVTIKRSSGRSRTFAMRELAIPAPEPSSRIDRGRRGSLIKGGSNFTSGGGYTYVLRAYDASLE